MSPADVFQPETEDRSFARDQMVRDWLRKPFKPEQIGKLPATARRPALDFVGHAAVTDRLNRIAPDWTYSVLERFLYENKIWIHGSLTLGGVTREEFGDGDDPKEALGNFLRRAAMRFGVAIDLWSREELGDSAPPLRGGGADKPEGEGRQRSRVGEGTTAAPPPPSAPTSGGEQTGPAPAAVLGQARPSGPPPDLWDEARDLGLTPPKAVVMARKAGWDDVRSSTDLSDDQLRELIETRRKELV
jgi:hypothetical protein